MSMIPDGASLGQFTAYTATTEDSEFLVDNSRDAMNRILGAVNLSPIRSQARKHLDLQSDSGVRRLVSKLVTTVRVIQSTNLYRTNIT